MIRWRFCLIWVLWFFLVTGLIALAWYAVMLGRK
jgi:hypothetical protein